MAIKNLKIFKLVSIAFLMLLILVSIFIGRNESITIEPKKQLSQIIALETGLLKDWQQRGGLKNTLAYSTAGEEVSLLQRMLSQDTTIYPAQKVTGYYGDQTLEAVRKFQKEQGIQVTGNVDTVTKDKINEIFLKHLCPETSHEFPEMKMFRFSKEKILSADYVPPDLVDVSDQILSVGVTCVRSDIIPDLTKMISAAKLDDVELMITSGYRKPEIQKYLYDYWIGIEGPGAIHEVALPGKSEHQLGTTVDFTDASIQYAGVDDRFSESAGGLWLKKHAHVYGFHMSFQKEKESVTGFIYEPWHWRYVGPELATELYERNITFSEYSTNDRN